MKWLRRTAALVPALVYLGFKTNKLRKQHRTFQDSGGLLPGERRYLS